MNSIADGNVKRATMSSLAARRITKIAAALITAGWSPDRHSGVRQHRAGNVWFLHGFPRPGHRLRRPGSRRDQRLVSRRPDHQCRLTKSQG